MSPVFVTLQEVLAIHAHLIERYGGSSGVRDFGLLQSALGMPQQSFGGAWLHASIHEMAAAYLFHLCKNHPFVDGNKRTALGVAIVFLGLNGETLWADPDALIDRVLGVAEGRVAKSDLAAFLLANTNPRVEVK